MKKKQESSKKNSISFSEILDAQERDCKKGLPIDAGLAFYYKNKDLISKELLDDMIPTDDEVKRLGELIKEYDAS